MISYLPGDQTGSNEIEEKKPTRSSKEHVFAWSEINSSLLSASSLSKSGNIRSN